MSNLTIMILCGRSPRHIHFANRLCRAGKALAIVQETGGERKVKKLKKLLTNPRNLQNRIWRWLRDRKRYAGGGESSFFFGSSPLKLSRPDLLVNVSHINHQDVLMLADRLKPDLIAVFGTSLIRGELLNRGRLGIVNLHGGLSPLYRGADCTFWALYNKEPDKIGCTLHFIDRGIDTGRLIAHICPEIRADDDELTLFWRSVRESGEVFADFLCRLENGQRFGVAQSHRGRLYQVKDRGYHHELELRKSLEQGLLKSVNLPLRVRWFHT